MPVLEKRCLTLEFSGARGAPAGMRNYTVTTSYVSERVAGQERRRIATNNEKHLSVGAKSSNFLLQCDYLSKGNQTESGAAKAEYESNNCDGRHKHLQRHSV